MYVNSLLDHLSTILKETLNRVLEILCKLKILNRERRKMKIEEIKSKYIAKHISARLL